MLMRTRRARSGTVTLVRSRRSPLRIVMPALAMSCVVALSSWLAVSDALALGGGADGKYDKRTSSHFVLYQDVDIDRTSGLRGSRRFEQDVLATLESAYHQLDQRLGLRPDRPITVSVHDPAIFDARFAGLFRFPAAGFYGGTVHVRGGTMVDGRLQHTLHHELVHAALDAEAPGLFVPAWMNEGLAEYFEARALGKRGLSAREAEAMSRIASSGSAFSLADLAGGSFGHLGPDGAGIAYLQSYAFIDYLAQRSGERRLREWVRDFVRTGDLDRVTRRIHRADLADLELEHLDARRLDGPR
jgi:hypothetical protein